MQPKKNYDETVQYISYTQLIHAGVRGSRIMSLDPSVSLLINMIVVCLRQLSPSTDVDYRCAGRASTFLSQPTKTTTWLSLGTSGTKRSLSLVSNSSQV